MSKLQVLLVSKVPNLFKLFSSIFRKGLPSLHLFEDTQNAINFYKENQSGDKIVILDESIKGTNLQLLINDILAFNTEEKIIFLSSAPLDSICQNKVSANIAYYIDKDYLTSHLNKFPKIIDYYIQKIFTIKQKKLESKEKEKTIDGTVQELKLKYHELVNSIDSLPTLPSLYQEFMTAVEKEKPINEIADIIKKNSSVAAKVLQVANSAFYGLKETTSIDFAMVYIGLNPVKDIVLTLTLTSNMKWNDEQIHQLQKIFGHSNLLTII